MMRSLLLIFLTIVCFSSLNAQNNYLSDCGNLIAGDNCNPAIMPSLCELDGFSTSTSGLSSDGSSWLGAFCGPGTGIHNNMWIAFVPPAGTNNVQLDFLMDNCVNAGQACSGVQAAIVESSDCMSGTSLTCVNCITSSFTLTAAVTPGQLYYIMIDGCCGDVCDFTIDVVEGLPDPSFTVDITGFPICEDGQETTLFATANPPNNSYIYQWFGPNGEIVGQTGSSVEVDQIGNYSVIVREPIDCCFAENASTISLVADAPTASGPSSAMINCGNSEINLVGSFAPEVSGHDYQYTWLAPNGTNLGGGSNTFTTTVMESDPEGEYIFFVYDATTGCTDEFPVMITIDNELPMADAGAPGTIGCGNTTYILDASGSSGNGTLNYEWIYDNNGTDASVYSGSDNTFETNLPGDYTLIVTDIDNGCTMTDVNTIELMNDGPVVDYTLSIPSLDCNNILLQINGILDINSVETGDDITYVWTDASGTVIPTNNLPSISVSDAGMFTLVTTNTTSGCSTTTGPIEIMNNDALPTVSAGTDATVDCSNSTATFTATASGGMSLSYQWTLNGIIVGNTASLDVNEMNPGVYTLEVTNDDTGCTNTDDVELISNSILPEAEAGMDVELTCANMAIELIGSEISGNGTNFAYTWLNNANVSQGTGTNLTVTAPGVYIFQVENTVTGCTHTDMVTVTQNNTPPVAVIDGAGDLNCITSNLILDANNSTVQGTASYAWSDGSSNPTLGVSSPGGTFTVTVTDSANGCTHSMSATVGDDMTAPTPNAGPDMVLDCANNQEVILMGSASGVPNVTYQWQDASGGNLGTNEMQTVTTMGTYTLVATNTATGCSESTTVNVTLDTAPPENVTADDGIINCGTGQFTLNGNTTSTNVTTSWTGPGGYTSDEVSPTITSAGTYTFVVVNNENGCSATADAVVSPDSGSPMGPTFDSGGVNVLNCNQPTIDITGINNDVDPTVVLSWILPDGSTDNNTTITISQEGVYTIVATGTNGCSSSSMVNVDEDFDLPIIDGTTGGTIDCENAMVDLSLSTMTNVDYEWAGPGLLSPPSDPTPSVNAGGDYMVTITSQQNGCTATTTVSVAEDMEALTAAINSTTNTTTLTCAEPMLTLEATSPTSGVNYEWSEGGATTSSLSIDNAGTYTVTITNPVNQCASTASIVIDANGDNPSATADGETITCLTTDAQLSVVTDAANPAYAWSGPNSFSSTDPNPTTNVGGVYNVTVTDLDNGCVSESSYEVIANNTNPDISTMGAEINCLNSSVTLTGASTTAGVDFLWTGPGINASNETMASPMVSEPGDYTLQVLDPSNGCMVTSTTTITIDGGIPVADATGGIIDCNNMMTGVSLMGTSSVAGVDFLWTGPGIDASNESEQNPTVTEIGTYTLMITDGSNGCSAMSSTTVDDGTNPPTGVTATGGTLLCSMPSLQLMGASDDPDVTYTWSGGDIDASNENDQNPTIGEPGTYTLTVTSNANGCEASTTASVVFDGNPPNASATAVGVGVITCSNQAEGIQIQGTTNVPNASYDWVFPNGMTSTEQMPTIMEPGEYSLTITDLDNGCTSPTMVIISGDFDEPGVTVEDALITCASPSVTLQGNTETSGSIFEWIGPDIMAATASNSSVSVELGGEYIVIVTGPNGCTSSATSIVSEEVDNPDAVIPNTDLTLTCTQPNIDLNAVGSSLGDNFVYEWSDPLNSNTSNEETFTASSTGTYSLLVTNELNGCTNTATVDIDENMMLPTADAGLPQTFACSTTELTLDAGASTGQGNLSYEWVGIGTTPQVTILGPGDYEVIVTDAINGCTDSATVTVDPDLNAPSAVAASSNMLTCAMATTTLDGAASTSISGGALTYEWSFNGSAVGTGETVDVSIPGTYTLLITDETNGCVDSEQILVESDTQAPTVIIAAANVLTCAEPSTNLDGTASDTGNFSYMWTVADGGNIIAGETTLTPEIDNAGTYTLAVTNEDNGCISSETITVSQDADFPQAAITILSEFTCADDEVSLNTDGSSSGTGFSYAWDGPSVLAGANGETVTIGVAGTYGLTVTNVATGCTQNTSMIIPPNTNMITDAPYIVNPESCNDTEDGLIAIEAVVDGTPPYLYSINGGFLGSTQVFTGLAPGNYDILVQDAEGCEFPLNIDVEPGVDVVLELGPDQTINLGDSTTIIPQVNNDNYTLTWSDTTLQGNTPTISPVNSFTYQATVVDENGCIDTDNITIFVERNRNVYIPNAFSPNNDDGINDIVYIRSDETVEQVRSFRIYDRWGALMYEAVDFLTNDPQYGWDGLHKGDILQPAVFVYYAEIKFKDGLVEIYKGDVTLMR